MGYLAGVENIKRGYCTIVHPHYPAGKKILTKKSRVFFRIPLVDFTLVHC